MILPFVIHIATPIFLTAIECNIRYNEVTFEAGRTGGCASFLPSSGHN